MQTRWIGRGIDGARAELAWLARGLRTPGLYGCLLGALLVWALAWQVQTTYVLDVGGLDDDAFVRHFNDKEPDPKKFSNPPLTYRWSQQSSALVWPGLGNAPLTVTLRLAGSRPGGLPPPVVTATVRGQTFPLAITNDLRDYPLAVGRGNPLDGDLAVQIAAPRCACPGDPRELGVLVDSATLTPASRNLFPPPVVPPIADLARWAAALGVLWLLVWRLSGQTRLATAAGGLAAAAIAWAALAERPNLGLLAPAAPVLLLGAYPLALIGVAAARAMDLSPRPSPARGGESRVPFPGWGPVGPAEGVAGALVAGFLLRVGGMVYPQFISSDIRLHAHNIEKVLAGTLVWTGVLPNGAPQPYPPLPYLALAPFAGLVPDLTLLWRVGGGLIDAACVLPLYYLGRRLGGPRAGAWAGWVYAALAAPFSLFSAGVFANLFAAAVFTWTLAAWGAVLLASRVRPGGWAALGLGFFLTALSHYGMLIAAVAVTGLYTVLALAIGPGVVRRRALGVAAALLLAGLGAYLVYYVHFTDVLLAPVQGVSRPPGPPAPAGGVSLAGLVDILRRRLGPDLGGLALLAAGAGWASLERRGQGLLLLAAATGLASLGFAAASLVAGENIRYALLFAPFVALGAGLLLARLAARGRWGRWWAILVLAGLFWHLLAVWLPLIFTRYHTG
ncbi:MAG TPA: hypothetical protein VKY74_15895 [Chloroflexia bacterium]|nr:hypothetical protein [Chloroflexia bacterium]